jgi:hypothetical protein
MTAAAAGTGGQMSGRKSERKRFVYYQEGEFWVGWLEEFPDYRSQGRSQEELKENLRDLYLELTSGRIPFVRRVGELAVA